MADHFFLAAFRQIWISVHQIFDDAHHLNDKLPILFLFFRSLLNFRRVLIKTFPALFLGPCKSFLKFFFVVDTFCHTADDFHFIHGFHTHAQIFFDKCRINDGSADSHTDGSDLQIGFSPHGGSCHSRTAEAEKFFLYIFRNLRIVCILHIMAINTERRKPLLGMGSQYGSQINRSGTLRSIEAPNRFDGHGIHVHGFCAVAPARRYGQCDIHAFFFKLCGTGCGLRHTADGGVRDDNLHRFSVGISQIICEQFCGGFRHVHGLLFQRFSYF